MHTYKEQKIITNISRELRSKKKLVQAAVSVLPDEIDADTLEILSMSD
jgi:hypothetical protein